MSGSALATATQDPRQLMRRHGKTFSWASGLLGIRVANDVAVLYAFCRHLDDMADDVGGEAAMDALDQVSDDLRRGQSSNELVQRFIELLICRQIPTSAVDSLIAALKSDTGPRRVGDWDEAVRYAYGVASTVGIMFCAIVGVRRQQALAFAIDLGIAMQLTNMSRDVLEDALSQRSYLPFEQRLGQQPCTEIAVGDLRARTLALGVVRDGLELANCYYRSADDGMRYLPWRARAAVMIAARCYEAIGGVILAKGDSYWESRSYVGVLGKIWHTARALGDLVFRRKYRANSHGPRHDRSLHRALAGLPGADQ